MKGRLILFGVAAIALGGCASNGAKSATDQTSPTTSASTKTADIPKSEAPPAGPDPASLPASLRHEGFEWYGLGYGKPIKMTFDQGGTKMTGNLSYTLESLQNGVAVYKQEWDGELATTMGTSLYRLTDKGVFGLEAKGAKVDPPQLELPAKITPGFAWQSNGKIDFGTASVTGVSSRIVGIKPLKLGGREIQALVVKRSSKLMMSGKPQTMETVEYYEKGVGAVKLEVNMKGSKPFTLEVTP